MNRLIAAIDRQRGLAKHGVIPWNIPEELVHFSHQTKAYGGHLLTGAVTFREAYHGRALKDRQNYILTHDLTPIAGVTLVHDLAKFLSDFKDKDLWIAGGAAVFEEVMAAGQADELYLTLIDANFGCDQFFPDYAGQYKLVEQSDRHEQNGFHFTYNRYTRT